MHKNTLLFFIGFLTLVCAPVSFAQQQTPDVVTVDAVETTSVQADSIEWKLTLSIKGAETNMLSDKMNTLSSEMRSVLGMLTVTADSISQSPLEIVTLTDKDGAKYDCRQQCSFVLKGREQLAPIERYLATVTALETKSRRFFYSDMKKIKEETTRKALLAAREKAAFMANALGMEITNPNKITENRIGDSAPPILRDNNTSSSGSLESAKNEGTVYCTVSVTVSYIMKPRR